MLHLVHRAPRQRVDHADVVRRVRKHHLVREAPELRRHNRLRRRRQRRQRHTVPRHLLGRAARARQEAPLGDARTVAVHHVLVRQLTVLLALQCRHRRPHVQQRLLPPPPHLQEQRALRRKHRRRRSRGRRRRRSAGGRGRRRRGSSGSGGHFAADRVDGLLRLPFNRLGQLREGVILEQIQQACGVHHQALADVAVVARRRTRTGTRLALRRGGRRRTAGGRGTACGVGRRSAAQDRYAGGEGGAVALLDRAEVRGGHLHIEAAHRVGQVEEPGVPAACLVAAQVVCVRRHAVEREKHEKCVQHLFPHKGRRVFGHGGQQPQDLNVAVNLRAAAVGAAAAVAPDPLLTSISRRALMTLRKRFAGGICALSISAWAAGSLQSRFAGAACALISSATVVSVPSTSSSFVQITTM
eukprot:Rhum_TRINITY_DN12243_c0_g1::Rhum_TRINITY_DN12243_c0_g1_i2::g.50115::m.50115